MTNPTPGTLAEFDLVLSVTQALLNAQLMHLFLTRLAEDESQFLINHSMVLKTAPESKAGIFGSIECPQVLMDLPDVATNARVVRLAFKFLTNTPGSSGDVRKGIPPYDYPIYDSLFKWWDESEGEPELKSENINGWTFSFECSLGQANIQQIEEKYFHPSTVDQLQKAIDNKSFQPASLFCLFETGQLARSFQMADATGKLVTDQQAVSNFIIGLTTRFAPPPPDADIATPGNGLPTPDNPFVLGYGVRQVDPKPLPQTPQFDPRNFQFSVTHQPNGFGTLNFLMLLGPITPLTDVTSNLSAGIFATPFLTAIGADAPGTNGPQYDGTLVISAKSFKFEYIAKQLQDLFAMSNPTFPNISVHTDSNNVDWKSWNSYKTTAAWHSDQFGKSEYDVLAYNGTWGNEVAITSNYAGQRMPVDAARNLTITTSGTNWVRYLETVTPSWKYINPYGGTLSAETTIVPIDLQYNVTTNDQGAWQFTQNADKTKIPPMEDDPSHPGQKQLVLKKQNEQGQGLPVNTTIAGAYFKRAGWNEDALKSSIAGGLAPVARSIWAMYQAHLSNSLSSLNSQIVMPVGNVFTFNGLSLDKDGHVYTLMKYQTKSGDGKVMDVSSGPHVNDEN